MKNANFRIVVTMENHNVLFCKANSEQQLNIIKMMYLAQDDAECVEIYAKVNDADSYRLTNRFTKTALQVKRPIGFGRW